MPSDLDTLMDLDPLKLTKENIDQIIAGMRATLAQYDAGVKPVKVKPKVDTSSLQAALAPQVEKPKLRRI